MLSLSLFVVGCRLPKGRRKEINQEKGEDFKPVILLTMEEVDVFMREIIAIAVYCLLSNAFLYYMIMNLFWIFILSFLLSGIKQ